MNEGDFLRTFAGSSETESSIFVLCPRRSFDEFFGSSTYWQLIKALLSSLMISAYFRRGDAMDGYIAADDRNNIH